MRSALLVTVLLVGTAAVGWADTMNVGYFFLLQNVEPGKTFFSITNATGPSSAPPDFPVLTNLDFTNVQLTVFCANTQCETDLGGTSKMFDVGTILSGDSDTSIIFDAADTFSKALLTLNFSVSGVTVDDGMGGTAPFNGSSSTSSNFLPSAGSELVAFDVEAGNGDFDLGMIADPSVPIGTVPEPCSVALFAAGATTLLLRSRKSARNS